ncbi:MAG: arylesterase [Zoogloeaceae bacterium]|nr:arylesterase [Zoogloeaceae bacterium]
MLKRVLLLVLLVVGWPALAAPVVLVFGDSLSAGYGISIEDSWPALLAKRLEDNRLGYTVSNASISGETTAGGKARLPEVLQRVRPAVVIIELGANDGLRGLPVAQMRQNLLVMITAARASKAKVLLTGMKLPPNYGPIYARQFEESFKTVASAEKVALLPFLLEPLGENLRDFQADSLHPTAEAQEKILDHVWPMLKPLL